VAQPKKGQKSKFIKRGLELFEKKKIKISIKNQIQDIIKKMKSKIIVNNSK